MLRKELGNGGKSGCKYHGRTSSLHQTQRYGHNNEPSGGGNVENKSADVRKNYTNISTMWPLGVYDTVSEFTLL